MFGLSPGSLRSILVIKFLAGTETLEGMWYSFFLIFIYVSLRQDVSKGGFPTNSVYLQNNKIQNETIS